MASDMLLAAQRGVCAVVNISCCVYVDQSGRIETHIKYGTKLKYCIK